MFIWLFFSLLTLFLYFCLLTNDIWNRRNLPNKLKIAGHIVKTGNPAFWFAMIMLGPIGFFIMGISVLMDWSDRK